MTPDNDTGRAFQEFSRRSEKEFAQVLNKYMERLRELLKPEDHSKLASEYVKLRIEATQHKELSDQAQAAAEFLAYYMQSMGIPLPTNRATAQITVLPADIHPGDMGIDGKEVTIADAAVVALQQKGSECHGEEILKTIQGWGFLKKSKYAMTNLATALRRDDRAEKVRGKRNYWKLK